VIRYRFLKNPDGRTVDRLIALYSAQGWWGKGDNRALLRRMVRGSRLFIAAFEGGRLAGMGRAIDACSREAYVHDVAVAREFRGRDIGTGLMRRLVARLKRDGFRWVGLISADGSAPFYKALGFYIPRRSAAMMKDV